MAQYAKDNEEIQITSHKDKEVNFIRQSANGTIKD